MPPVAGKKRARDGIVLENGVVIPPVAGAAEVGAHKTSMLQDLEAGRALETEALIGAVAELGRLVDVPSPTIDAVLACLRLFTKTNLAS
jgi:ketopantoate reductase